MKILKPGLPDMVSPDGKVRRSLGSYFSQEVDRLRDVSHENVVKVYERGSLELKQLVRPGARKGRTTPYYIMDFVDGSPILEWLENGRTEIRRQHVVRIIVQLLNGLAAVHRQGVLHGDVKPDNVLVGRDGNVRLTDFGFAKSLVRDDAGDTFWCQDKRYLHPELLDRLARSQLHQPRDTGRSIIPTTTREIKKKGAIWELHALGRTVEELLEMVSRIDPGQRTLNRNDVAFLRATISRLVEPRTVGPWSIPVWSDRYRSVKASADDVSKLSPGRSLAGEVPEYDAQHEDILRIPLSERVPMSRRLRPIIDHPMFQRLGQCTQLGVGHLVFRGARHTRYEHSLGVMHQAIEYARALWISPTDQYFHQAAGPRELEALILAALLHDIGQYPFAHAFEESETEGNALFAHEALTKAILSATTVDELGAAVGYPGLFLSGRDRKRVEPLLLDRDGHPIRHYLAGPAWDASVDDVLSLLDATRPTRLIPPIRDVLHAIVDGPIDADKMDYLRRDALHLDVKPGAAVDVTAFLRSLTLVDYVANVDGATTRRTKRLALDSKGMTSAEDLLMARYHMFTEVYWDRVVRAAERMLRHAVDGIRARMGEEAFRLTFFPDILTSDDQELLHRLRVIAARLRQSARASSRREEARGFEECLSRVLRRELHREALELDARRDAEAHQQLSNFWNRALTSGEARKSFAEFHRSFLQEARKTTGREWAAWELLLDIPDPRSDRAQKYQFEILLRSGKSSPITTESALWRNFADEFRIHARRIRVFAAHERHEKSDQMTASIRTALDRAREGVPMELREPLSDAGRRG